MSERPAPNSRRTLVVVDMQEVFADPASDWATPGFASIVPVVSRLVERFAPRVVFTRFVAPAEPAGAWVSYYEQWPFARQPPEAELWHLVPPFSDSRWPVVDAPAFGKWPALAPGLDADALVVCGVSTDCCVLSTVLPAADAGLSIEVVSDACAGLSDTDHQRALDAMALYAPLVTITTESALT
jgi:nicotinamidase-related amidase